MRTSRSMCSLVVLLILAVATAFGQLYTGSIAGVVKDPSGAVVPNAKVTVTDAGKGFVYTGTTDANGVFSIRALPPATYIEKVDVSGFNPYQREGIVLDVAGHVEANVTLQVASAGQTVTVSEAASPMLQTEDAVTGQTVNRTYINDLPLVGRSVFDLAFLTPGVTQAPNSAYGPGNIGNNFTSDGSRNAQSDILLDGVSTTSYEQNSGFVVPLYTPSVDEVQEFKVQQNNFSAEFGFTGGAVVNVVTRSGTNQFHGSLYEFWRNDLLNANGFFNDLYGTPRPMYRWNDFGGTIGGPIKKDKIFFFGSYEGKRQVTPNSLTLGLPDQAERAGNFGELCGRVGGTFNSSGVCSNPAGQIWDPYANLTYVNGQITRNTPIPYNNLATYASPLNGASASGGQTVPVATLGMTPNVAGNLLNPVALNILKYLPLPNISPGAAGYSPTTNWYGSISAPSNSNQYSTKIDYRISDLDQLSLKFGVVTSSGYSGGGVYPQLTVFDNQTQGINTGVANTTALNYTHTFNPTTLMTISAGYTHSWSHTEGTAALYPNFNPVTDLGLPSYILNSGLTEAPNISFGQGYGTVGTQTWDVMLYGSDVYQLLGSVSKTIGNHDVHFGAEVRSHRINFTQYGIPDGLFSFSQSGTSQLGNGTGGGDSLASFMVGLPTGWSAYQIPASPATQNLQYGGFVQDNWHVNDRLTLNVGVRYDIDAPRTERYNRMSYFDPNAPSPLQAEAGICPACANLLGSFEFVGEDGNPRTPFNTFYGAVAPRFGFAYRLGQNTTFRGGYGIFYDPSKGGAAGVGTGPGGFLGYVTQSSMAEYSSSDNVTPVANLSNPFPGGSGTTQPPGNTAGNLIGLPLGDGGSAPIRTFAPLPQEQSWSFGIEHQLPWNVLIDAEYVGRVGHHLYFGGDDNAIDHLPTAVQQMYINGGAQSLNSQVTWPEAKGCQALLGGGAYSNACWAGTYQNYNNYLPYPQYPYNVWGSSGVISTDPPWANSVYNAFQLKIEKRFSHGLQFLLTYTRSKSLDDSSNTGGNEWIDSGVNGSVGSLATVQDPNNLHLERSLSNFDIPDVFQFTWVYALPFGKGKMYGANWNRLVDSVLGGWQINGIYRWDDGTPLVLGLTGGTSVPTYGGQRPNLPTNLQISSNYGNTLQYFSNASGPAAPAGSTFTTSTGEVCYQNDWYPCQYADGTAPRTLSTRAPGTNNWTASIFKQFPLWSESSKLEFGAEAFNLFNHVQFAAPALTVGQANFGVITAQANQPRIIQLRAKLYF